MSTTNKKTNQKNAFYWLTVVIIILSVLYFKSYYSVYKVNFISMQPTLEDGDIVIAKKIRPHDTIYKNGEVLIFFETSGDKCIKRCLFNLNDSIELTRKSLRVNGKDVLSNYSSNTKFLVSEDDYSEVKYSFEGLFDHHKKPYSYIADFIGVYEDSSLNHIEIGNFLLSFFNDRLFPKDFVWEDSIFPLGMTSLMAYSHLSFDELKTPQYFLVGDNWKNSHDSRHIGFVPKKQIKAKAIYVVSFKNKTLKIRRIR